MREGPRRVRRLHLGGVREGEEALVPGECGGDFRGGEAVVGDFGEAVAVEGGDEGGGGEEAGGGGVG